MMGKKASAKKWRVSCTLEGKHGLVESKSFSDTAASAARRRLGILDGRERQSIDVVGDTVAGLLSSQPLHELILGLDNIAVAGLLNRVASRVGSAGPVGACRGLGLGALEVEVVGGAIAVARVGAGAGTRSKALGKGDKGAAVARLLPGIGVKGGGSVLGNSLVQGGDHVVAATVFLAALDDGDLDGGGRGVVGVHCVSWLVDWVGCYCCCLRIMNIKKNKNREGPRNIYIFKNCGSIV